MRNILLSTTVMMTLALPAMAQNSIKIDVGPAGGKVGSLAIIQDDTAASNIVSGNGTSGAAGTAFPVSGSWNSIAVNQTGGNNVLKGGIKSGAGSTTASLNANYATTSTGGNTHSLTIGGTTAPVDPTVKVFVSNNGASNNAITDNLNGTGLTYNLGLAGTGNTVGNAVTAATSVTLNQGDGVVAGIGGGYGIAGDNNTVANTIGSGAAVSANLRILGNGNSVTNTVTASGNVTLNQGGAYGITGDNNTVGNVVGDSASVGSLVATQTVSGDSNLVANSVNGSGAKTITQSLASNGNNVSVTMSADGAQTSNFAADAGSYVDYAHLSNAAASSADVSVNGVVGATTDRAVVRVEQTSAAGGGTVVLTVNGGAYTMGTLGGTLPGTYGAGGTGNPTPGVLVFQNSSGAYLSANVTAASNGYTAKFVQ